MSYTCHLMVLCECACANLISKAHFNLINRTDLFICLRIIFKKSHSEILRDKKVIARFWVFGQNFCSVYIPCKHNLYCAKLGYKRVSTKKTYKDDVTEV